MIMDKVKQFYEALANDEAMRKRAVTFNEKYIGTSPGEDEVNVEIISFASGEGYDFTAAELTAYAKSEAAKLPDNDLEAVAGGTGEAVSASSGKKCFDRGLCFCIVGGGGKHNNPKYCCGCVAGGGGKTCPAGVYFGCFMLGECNRKKTCDELGL
jgi:hypothetical protein